MGIRFIDTIKPTFLISKIVARTLILRFPNYASGILYYDQHAILECISLPFLGRRRRRLLSCHARLRYERITKEKLLLLLLLYGELCKRGIGTQCARKELSESHY